MSGVSVLTMVRNRSAHLGQLVEGLRRSRTKPGELVIIDMSDTPIRPPAADFLVHVERLDGAELPLAAARNRAAALARYERLVFLDVDCIPMRACVGMLSRTLDRHDDLACADVRYLGDRDARGAWSEEALLARGRAHPVRPFPERGVRVEGNPGLFWSLAFAIRKARFMALGGFDAAFVGYGAEDTDFGFRADRAGLKLLFVGGAIACHQHHESHDPPVQHLCAIVRNARLFHARWGTWPMRGWLDQFAAMGLLAWRDGLPEITRAPTLREIVETRTCWPDAEVR